MTRYLSSASGATRTAKLLRATVRLVVMTLVGTGLLAGSAGTASAAFGFRDVSGSLTSVQAGASPDITTTIDFNRRDPDLDPDRPGRTGDGNVRTMTVDLPPGLIGNLSAAESCDFNTVFDSASPEACPAGAQVGVASVFTSQDGGRRLGVFLVRPPSDDRTAWLVLPVAQNIFVPVLQISVRSDGDYGMRATLLEPPRVIEFLRADVTLWGVPADPSHDGFRIMPGGACEEEYDPQAPENPDIPCTDDSILYPPSTAPREAFITNPTSCPGTPLQMDVSADSFQAPGQFVRRSATMTGPGGQPAVIEGCDQLQFAPTFTFKPTAPPQPGEPSGFESELKLPQTLDPDAPKTSAVKRAVLTLPPSVVMSPSAADGLQACADSDLHLDSTGPAACPDGSKVGTTEIDASVLDTTLKGSVYLRPQTPEQLLRVAIVASAKGVNVKLTGKIDADPKTGELVATFDNTPQVPFEALRLRFFGGPRAPLRHKYVCGTERSQLQLTGWNGAQATPVDSYEVGGCQPRGFAPSWSAGTESAQAGGSSPFVMRIARDENQQEVNTVAATLPPGLLGLVSQVPLCSNERAAAGTCGEESRIGSVTAGSGPGPNPLFLSGRAYLTQGYKGAPYGISFVIPAKAGPFDLGLVNVRATVNIDRSTAAVSVASDPLPTILEGIPLDLRDMRIRLDRPGFMRNPTGCGRTTINGLLSSTEGGSFETGSPFEVDGCAALPFAPKFRLSMSGAKETKALKHPGVRATMTQAPGEAAVKQVRVMLPKSVGLDPNNARALCKPEEAAARACPAGSVVGHVRATTPVLNQPLEGPVYFVEGRRVDNGRIVKTLPKLWLALRGEVELDVWGDTTFTRDANKLLVTTFASVPDAPLSSFALDIEGGANGIIKTNTDICAKTQVAKIETDGHNGKRSDVSTTVPPECGFRILKTTVGRTSVLVRVAGIGAGRVAVSGKGARKTSRTIRSATLATVKVPLSSAVRRQIRAHRRVKIKLTAKYTATGAKKARVTSAVARR